jgi:NAD(P)-dependent dehydrogenase (short-subunit alcohol dehydrogenase family)
MNASESPSMENKTVVITGANTGIGLATAEALAASGARIIAACRNLEKGRSALERIAQKASGPKPELVALDLSNLASVRGASEKIATLTDAIDVLINNAGLILPRRQTSADGYEMQFATNHLGHFLLTKRLLPLIKQAEQGRIINLSSGAHWGGSIHFDDLMLEKRYGAFRSYGQTKLANILFTRALARRLSDTPITVNAVHPGFVRSNFAADRSKDNHQPLIMRLIAFAAVTPEVGAETSVYLAGSPEGGSVSGEYFAKSRIAPSSKASRDTEIAERLWKVSEDLVGEKFEA